MNDSTGLCRTIQAREKLVLKLAKAERQLAELPRYRWVQRRNLSREIASQGEKIAERTSRISDESVRSLANAISSALWDSAASEIIPKKNPYGPAARNRLDDIRDRATELASDYEVYAHRSQVSFPLSGLPEVKALITSTFIESNARREIDELASIAASPKLISEYDWDHEDKRRLRIQHVASGLRAQFTMDENGFGGIASKPYALDSIDPDKPGHLLDWQRYVGLGIGQRLYKEAHRLEPKVRWWGGMLSEYAVPLRRKLHSTDPYVWNWSSCTWCDVNLPIRGVPHWEKAARSTFSGHP